MKSFSKTHNASLFGIITLVVIIGFSMIACESETKTETNPFEGTWRGVDLNYDSVTVMFTPSSWSLTWVDYTGNYSGPYERSGNSATLYDSRNRNIGNASISGNTLTLIIFIDDNLAGITLRK